MAATELSRPRPEAPTPYCSFASAGRNDWYGKPSIITANATRMSCDTAGRPFTYRKPSSRSAIGERPLFRFGSPFGSFSSVRLAMMKPSVVR